MIRISLFLSSSSSPTARSLVIGGFVLGLRGKWGEPGVLQRMCEEGGHILVSTVVCVS